MTTNERHECSERVYHSGSVRSWGCATKATVKRTVRETKYVKEPDRYDEETFSFIKGESKSTIVETEKWFCGTHDPEKIAARQAKKDEERRKSEERRANVRASAEDLCRQLGAGQPAWSQYHNQPGYWTGGVTLSSEDAKKIIARLQEAEGRVREYESVPDNVVDDVKAYIDGKPSSFTGSPSGG